VAEPDHPEVTDAPTGAARPVGRHVHPDPAPDVEVAARRRRAILVGHNGDAGAARDLLTDPAAPVRAAALGALDRIARTNRADGPTTDELAASLADPAPAVRQRALEVLAGPGRLSDPDQPGGSRRDHDDSATRLLAPLLACLGDTDHSVLEVACWAAGELPEIAEATVDALVEVAGPARGQGAHEDALCREAAVAALGALGHERGRAAVLGGLEDRPAIRRRAVLALAAFEGDDVEAALKRALGDRDWQVQQAAEDLLGVSRASDGDDTPGPYSTTS